MSQEQKQIFGKKYEITKDNLSKGKNTLAIGYMLDMALDTSSAHDDYLTQVANFIEPLISDRETWVVTQYSIDIHALPQLEDEITIQTEVILANHFFVNRHFQLMRNEEVCVDIYSQYVGIDLDTREAVRLDVRELKAANIVTEHPNRRFAKIKVHPDFQDKSEIEYAIQDKDIDYNHHVNNTVYINWCLAALPAEFTQTNELKHIDVKYGQEILPNATVTIESYFYMNDEEPYTVHLIKNQNTEETACHIQMFWK
ncbi:hypothetical protein HZY86_00900 [Aerococcaceae bacterium DSM 111020]|nr:hypothetical protein [Aerococcaceae bacterium DSM 111020]